MKMIVDIELGDSKADDIKKEEHKQFVSFIIEYMNNMCLKLKDKSTQCRFTRDCQYKYVIVYEEQGSLFRIKVV